MFIVTNAHILILITGIISLLYVTLEILLVLLKQFSNYKHNVPIDSYLERFQVYIQSLPLSLSLSNPPEIIIS